jgi:hypothetical protein
MKPTLNKGLRTGLGAPGIIGATVLGFICLFQPVFGNSTSLLWAKILLILAALVYVVFSIVWDKKCFRFVGSNSANWKRLFRFLRTNLPCDLGFVALSYGEEIRSLVVRRCMRICRLGCCCPNFHQIQMICRVMLIQYFDLVCSCLRAKVRTSAYF